MSFKDERSGLGQQPKREIEVTFMRRVLAFMASVNLVAQVVLAQTTVSTPVDIGYRDYFFKTGDVTGAPTEEKPQSKLWYNNGGWWGVLWDPVLLTFRIHRLDLATQAWTSVGPSVDERPRSGADALWDGTKLYVASSAKRNHRPQDGNDLARIYRYSYDSASRSYSLDVGFPVLLNGTEKTRGIVLIKDSTDQLWATWTADAKVMVNRTVGNDAIWGQPFVLPAQVNDLKVEPDDFTVDVSSIVAFGDKVGILWGNQNPNIVQDEQRYYFSVHFDSEADTVWQTREDVLPGLSAFDPKHRISDDHLNIACSPDGSTVLAVVKTGVNRPGFPFVAVAKRAVNGNWSYTTYGTSAQAHTRPIILYDSNVDSVYVFARSDKEGREAIYLKSAHVDNLVFPPGFGTLYLNSDEPNLISNPTSTKQCVDETTGLVLLASDRITKFYYHNYLIGGNAPPTAADDDALTQEGQPLAIEVLANDSDPDGTIDVSTLALVASPANGAVLVDSILGTITYTPNAGFAGRDTLKYTFRDDSGVSARAGNVSIVVNKFPLALDDAAVTSVETAVSIDVLTNDFDIDGSVDSNSLTLVSLPGSGTATINPATAEIEFVPPPGFAGMDAFSYTVNDNQGASSNIATVTVMVNEFPVANNDSVATVEELSIEIDVLANDFDPDASLDPSSVAVQSQPANGSAAANLAAGTITYTPNPNYFGFDSFTYNVADEFGAESNVATVTVEINRPPFASNDAFNTHEDTPTVVNVTANDVDLDGVIDSTSVRIASLPSHGTATADSATGRVTYVPGVDYSGADAFTYTVRDDDGTVSNVATVSVGINDAPVAANDSVLTHRGVLLNIDVKDNDTDSDGSVDPATVKVQMPPTSGEVAVDTSNGVIAYTPDADFFGTDTFTYSIDDLQGATSDPATVSIGVNNPPVTMPDSAETIRQFSVNIAVLANDADVDGSLDPATVSVVNSPSNGATVVDTLTGSITYSPNAAFSGTEAFSYRVADNQGGFSAPEFVIVAVAFNATPVAVDDSASTEEDMQVVIDVLSDDSDADVDGSIDVTTVAIVTQPPNGAATANPTTGAITYVPNANFFGLDTFAYSVRDNIGATSNAATVSVSVLPVNDAPQAVADTVFTNERTAATVAVVVNDVDIDGTVAPATVTLGATPANGTALVQPTGEIVYTPSDQFSGSDSLTYSVRDNDGALSNVATVLVFVNDSPIANDDSVTTDEEQQVVIDVLSNDNDSDGTLDPSLVAIVSAPSHGSSARDDSTGSIVYTPVKDFAGQDTLTYSIRDNQAAVSNVATVRITVRDVNDPPVAAQDSSTTNEDTAVGIDVLANDTDIDGQADPVTVTLVQGPRSGTASVDDTTGLITYLPNENFFGSDTLSYSVRDEDTAVSNVVLVYLTVLSVNDAPTAVDDSARTNRDAPIEIDVVVNDSDVDGLINPSTVSASQGSNGSTTVQSNGRVTYTPTAGFFGLDNFTYTVKDDAGGTSNQAIVTVLLNDLPAAVNDTSSTLEDNSVTIDVLSNDSDSDGTLTVGSVVLTAGPSNGAAEVDSANGRITYTPDPDFFGADSVAYTVSDDEGAMSNRATVTLDIQAVNDPPVANNDTASISEDNAVEIAVLANDSDIDGTLVLNSVRVSTGPTRGSVTTDSSSGTIIYTPNTNYFGTDSLSYEVTDDSGDTSRTASVFITVTSVNDLPVTADDSGTVSEDSSLVLAVLSNDLDPDGTLDPASVSIVLAPTNGAATVDTVTGQITFIPNRNFAGPDSLKYYVKDNAGDTSNVATVNLIVSSINDTPVAANDSVATSEDTPVTIAVLANDSDVDGTLVLNSVRISTGPTRGSATTDTSSGRIIYTPGANYFGTDSFSYTVSDDGGATSGTASVFITVTSVNDLPVTSDDSGTVEEDSSLVLAVLSNDVDSDGTLDPASVSIVLTPANGTATVDAATGDVTFIPNRNFVGPDSLKYHVRDNAGDTSNIATVNLIVSSINDAPVAANDSVATSEDTPIIIAVLTNDTDVDGTLDKLSVTIVTDVANGSASLDAATSLVTYTPNANFGGTDVFTYTVRDDLGMLSNQASVTIAVLSVNDLPVAVDDSATLPEDTQITIDVVANDQDVDSAVNSATVIVESGPANGVTTVSQSGEVTYIPNADFSGSDTFTYTVADDQAARSNPASVSLTVSPLNDPPVAVDDTVTTSQNTPIVIAIISNDLDADGNLDPGTIAIVGNPAIGTVAVDATGSILYSPSPGLVGGDHFTYRVSDSAGVTSNRATVTVTVSGNNNPPIAQADVALAFLNAPVVIPVTSNDSDADGILNLASLAVAQPPSGGTAEIVGTTGRIVYTPNLGFLGQDSFSYTILDNGNLSSNVAFVTLSVNASTLTFTPIQDAHVRSNDPSKNYGSAAEHRAKKTSTVTWSTFLKFDVSGLVAGIQSAQVRLVATEASSDGGTIFPVSNTFSGSNFSWTEDLLVHINAPTDLDDPLSSVGAVSVGETVGFNVVEAITGAGIYSFGINNQSSDVVGYSSKEGSNPPELVIILRTSALGTPQINSFSPGSGLVGDEVTISGSDLAAVTAVKFGGISTSGFFVDSDSQLRALVPAGAITNKLTVLSPLGSDTSADDFIIPAPPTISSLTPTSGPQGTEVRIVGNNLIPVTEVTIGGTPVASFGTESNSELRAFVPAGASSGKIRVTSPSGSAISDGVFTITAGPAITSFTPDTGLSGTVVTVIGVNFSGVTTVAFNGLAASSFSIDSNTEIQATAPVGVSTGKIRVTNSEGTAFSNDVFTLIQLPAITAFAPASGVVGTEITITGVSFLTTTQVEVGGVQTTEFSTDSDTQLRAAVPVGAATGVISITNAAGGTASSGDFTVRTGPASASFSPTADSFIRSSKRQTNYGSHDELRVKDASTDYISFLKFQVTGVSGLIGGATLRLRVIDGSTDGGTVHLVSNNYLDGSAPWTEDGVNWDNAPALGSTALHSVGAVSVGEIAVFDVTPAIGGNGTFSFAIESSSSDVVKYEPREGNVAPELLLQLGSTPGPNITSFTPASGVAGNHVTIAGSNFSGATAVSFNGVAAASFTLDSNSQLRAVVPVAANSGPLSVTTGSSTGTSSQNFTVISNSPGVTSFTPTAGPTGTEVTINGQQLSETSQVLFNGATASGLTVVSSAQVLAIVPSGASTGPITLSVGGSTVTAPGSFTVATGAGGTFTFNPTDDAYVRSTRPTRNSGTTAELRVRLSSTDYDSYLKFAVSGLFGDIQNAVLRLKVIDGGVQGGTIFFVGNALQGSSNPWTENNLTFNDAPEITDSPLDTRATVSLNQIVEFNVTAAISGDGTYSFAISNEHSNTVKYSSKEGETAPELVITIGSGGGTPPVLSSFLPATGAAGMVVTLQGENLAGVTAVTFNGMTAVSFSVDDDTQVRATAPVGVTTGPIAVTTTSGAATTAADFGVAALLTISSFSPGSGSAGSEVTLAGTGFTGAIEVSFNGQVASAYTVDSDTQIRATVPAGATTGTVSVTTAAATVQSGSTFTVVVGSGETLTFTPTHDAFVRSSRVTRNYGAHGELRVRLSSTDYDSYFKFNVAGVSGSIVGAQLRLRVIDGGSEGGSLFVVSNNFKGTSIPWNQTQLTFGNAPEITGTAVSSQGAVSLDQTIEFDVTAAVSANGTFSFAITNEHSNTVKYSSKEGIVSPKLVVTTGSAISEAPTISSFSPVVGPVATEVTINGSGFSGATEISFNGTLSISVTVESSIKIVASVPSGSTNGKIIVTTAGGSATSTNDFVVFAAPIVDSFAPTSGPSGTQVTISGSNFSGVTSVSFNGVPANDFTFTTVSGETKIRAAVPPGATTGKIRLTNAAGSGFSGDDFVVGNSPAISSFAPALGIDGTEVTLAGVNFTDVTAISFNGSAAASFSFDSDTQLRAVAPLGATTGPISVTTASGSAFSADDFNVVTQPSITTFDPVSGLVGTEVIIGGSGLVGVTDVAFNGTSAASFVVNSNSEIRVTIPVAATTGKISATNAAGSAISSDVFTVTTSLPVGTFAFNPTDDSFVRSTRPDQNYRNNDELRVRKSSTDYDSYLKFTVTGLSAPVTNAALKLEVIDDGDEGGEIYSVSNNLKGTSTPWTQATLTFNTAPEITGVALDVQAGVAIGEIVEFDVTVSIAGDGTYSFAISNEHFNVVKYSSKEGVRAPELVILTGLARKSDNVGDLSSGKNIDSSEEQLPTDFTLGPNFPNPFNIETTISYALPSEAKVRLAIYNLRGQLVRVLVDDQQRAGIKRILWDGKNASDHVVGTGVYFVRLKAGTHSFSRKITLQK